MSNRPIPKVIVGAATLLAITVATTTWTGPLRANSVASNDGPLEGLEAIPDQLPWFDDAENYPVYDSDIRGKRADAVPAVTSIGRPPMEAPIELMLTRHVYPALDGHVDAIVRFDMELEEQPDGELHASLHDAGGQRVSEATIEAIPGPQVFFSYHFPEQLHDADATLRVRWTRNGETVTEAEADFTIAAPEPVERSGRVRLDVPNTGGAHVRGAPMTVGVPFPHGVLDSTDHLRLVDADGEEVPLQVKRTNRWSRFGSIRWVLCDFTLDLAGEPRTLYLEFGPDVSRSERDAIAVDLPDAGVPSVDAGRVRIDGAGLAYDIAGDSTHRRVLEPEAMLGGFVEHAAGADFVGWGHRWMSSHGKRFTMPEDTTFEIEQIGPEKTVLKAAGWFEHEETGERFCKFVNRYVIHRDSPIVRVFHTWIFTGDGNRDQIRNMGWRFPTVDLEPEGFLTHTEGQMQWEQGYYLRQHEHDEFALFELDGPAPYSRSPEDVFPARPVEEIGTGERSAGVIGAANDNVQVHLGVQDFWQNFPSSLKLEPDALTFYQWPRYGREQINPPHPDQIDEVWRLWFAHEGEVLSFQLPQQITQGDIYVTESGPEPHFAHGRPQSVNAQGIAKTAEMWLYLAEPDEDEAAVADVFAGLADETLRPVVDPQWVARSGAFYEIGAKDDERYPQIEAGYDDNLRASQRQIERMGVYGKWIYGDLLRSADLDEQTGGLYRIFRKGHWGWPMSFVPFARSGETDVLRMAQSAARMISDTSFVHYVSDDVRQQFEDLPERRMWDYKQPFREIGFHNRNLIPWAGYWGPSTRLYADEIENLWYAWFLTGYERGVDVIEKWAAQTKIEAPFTVDEEKMGQGPLTAGWNRGRWPMQIQKQYMEMYQATWDPWFFAGAHAIAEMHQWRYHEEDYGGHIWNTGPREYQRYTNSPDHLEFYLNFAEQQADRHQQGWASTPSTQIPSAAHGWRLTGEEHYLRRLAGLVDLLQWAIYEPPEHEYYGGFLAVGDLNTHMLFTSWMQKWYPIAIGAFEEAGGMPEDPMPVGFDQRLPGDTRILVRKAEGESLLLRTQGEFAITGPDGETIEAGEADEFTLDAELPAGTYSLELGSGSVRLPISPLDTPEVLTRGTGETIGGGATYAQHWFHVPEGVESFRIEFENPGMSRQSVRQIIVWNADGEEVWAHRQRAVDRDADQDTIEAEISVDPAQQGRLWRVTLPGRNRVDFRLDEQIPHVLAHDPTRWFDPDED